MLLSISSYSQETKGDKYFQEAKDWLDKGSNEKAIQSLLDSRAAYLNAKNYYRYFVATQSISNIYQDLNDGAEAEKIILDAINTIPKDTNDLLELHAKLEDNLGYTYLYNLNELEKGVNAYSQSISIYETIGKSNTKGIAMELVNRALTYQKLSMFDRSNKDLVSAISIYEKIEDTPLEELANNYYSLGLNCIQLQEFDQALSYLQKGLNLINDLPTSEIHVLFYNAIGNAYADQSNHQLALKNYELSKSIAEKLFGKDADHYCQSINLIGDAYKNMGDWETALSNYQEILVLYQKTPPKDLDNVIYLMISVSNTMTGLGMFDKARVVDEQALIFVTAAFGENSQQEAEVYKHMGVVAYNHGEDDKSLTYNFKALSLLESSNYTKNGYYAEVLENIGMAYDAMSDFDLALSYKQKAIDLYSKVYSADHSSVAALIGNIGLTYESINDYEKALDYLNQSIKILSKDAASNKKDLGVAFMDIGRIYLKQNDPKKAIENLEKARLIFEAYSKNLNKAKVYNELGAAYFLLKDFDKSATCFQKAIIANVFNFENENFDASPTQQDYLNYYELLTSYISKADVYRVRRDKANLLKGLDQLALADKLLMETIVNFDNAQDRLKLSQLNAFFTEAGLQLTDQLYSITKDQFYLEKAYYISERSKANELLKDIRLNKAITLARVPKSILARTDELTTQLTNLRQQLASAASEQNQALLTKLKAQEFDLTKEYELIQIKINEAAPKLSTINNKKLLPGWKEVSKSINEKMVIVSYSITDSAKYILIGNNSKLLLKKINPTINLDKLVRAYINQIKFKQDDFKQMAERLTTILWTPVEDALITLGIPNPEKVIIIPEGSITYLPFESLGKEKFLIEKYPIYYSFSGALLINSDKQNPKEKPSFISMAPVFEDKETNFVNKSCERFVEYSKKADTTSRAFSINGNYITPLPGTRSEVEKINQLHIDNGSVTKYFIEEDASEERIKQGELENFDYIHLATHGFVNSQYPELSGLLLTQDPKSTEDGILYSGEILGLKLNAQLVTLSACETALGKKIEGEGIRGLSTAFIFAGAKNVIASLWKVSDQSTSELMIEFYTELLSGKDKATSLRLAKLSLINTEKYNHPYYWAPFVQIGAN